MHRMRDSQASPKRSGAAPAVLAVLLVAAASVRAGADEANLMHAVPLGDGSRLSLRYAGDPDLDVFRGSLGVFFERAMRPDGAAAGGDRSLHAGLRLGAINMPNLVGARSGDRPGRWPLEKTLLLSTARIGFEVRRRVHGGAVGPYWGLRDTLFARLAYSLYDLAPTIRAAGRGDSLSEALSEYSSGLSYSTLRMRTGIFAGMELGDRELELSLSADATDFLYADFSAGLSYLSGPLQAGLWYDWASYETFNGMPVRGIRADIGFDSEDGVRWRARIAKAFEGEWSLSLEGRIDLAPPAAGSAGGSRTQRGPSEGAHPLGAGGGNTVSTRPVGRDAPWGSTGDPVEYRFSSRQLVDALSIGWDETILDRRDLSIHEIAAVLTVHRVEKSYDYTRVMSLDYTDVVAPAEYISRGGVCRDAANATAHLLLNNGYPARVVLSKQAHGAPHAFVVTRDTDGSFYVLNYGQLLGIPRSESLRQAAASYSPFLSLMLLDPSTHRVTDVVVSPDGSYLESVAGVEP